MKIYPVKENHIGSVVSKIVLYGQTKNLLLNIRTAQTLEASSGTLVICFFII